MNTFTRRIASWGLLLASLCLSMTLASADANPLTQPATQPATSYPLSKCLVSDHDLDADAVTKIIDGREVRFCCEDCVSQFEPGDEAMHAKMDAAIVSALKDKYPLKKCIVSGEALGSMGDPIFYVHRPTNQLVEFCCKSCIKKFTKDPQPFLQKLAEAK